MLWELRTIAKSLQNKTSMLLEQIPRIELRCCCHFEVCLFLSSSESMEESHDANLTSGLLCRIDWRATIDRHREVCEMATIDPSRRVLTTLALTKRKHPVERSKSVAGLARRASNCSISWKDCYRVRPLFTLSDAEYYRSERKDLREIILEHLRRQVKRSSSIGCNPVPQISAGSDAWQCDRQSFQQHVDIPDSLGELLRI
ncbi:hypothetical protein BDW68DRAFT_172148 [Aspergillus falconensis]